MIPDKVGEFGKSVTVFRHGVLFMRPLAPPVAESVFGFHKEEEHYVTLKDYRDLKACLRGVKDALESSQVSARFAKCKAEVHERDASLLLVKAQDLERHNAKQCQIIDDLHKRLETVTKSLQRETGIVEDLRHALEACRGHRDELLEFKRRIVEVFKREPERSAPCRGVSSTTARAGGRVYFSKGRVLPGRPFSA